MLMVPRPNGVGVGVITPCSFTTATTGLPAPWSNCSASFFGSRAASFSATVMPSNLALMACRRLDRDRGRVVELLVVVPGVVRQLGPHAGVELRHPQRHLHALAGVGV